MNKLTKLNFIPIVLLIGMVCLNGCQKEEERTYELLPPQDEPEMDITPYGALSANRENAGGATANEGSLKLVDNDYSTKFLINPWANDFYVQLAFPGGISASAYLLVSGNDAPSRDPKSWNLVGSNDLENWHTLDTQVDFAFSGRNQAVRFDFDNSEQYRYYRLEIKEIFGGSGLFQMSEWRLYYTPSSIN